MNRRSLFGLTAAAIPAAVGLKTTPNEQPTNIGGTVVVDSAGNILDLGGFPEEARGNLQLQLDWLHDHEDYTLLIDYPILHLPGGEDGERVSGFDQDAVIVHEGKIIHSPILNESDVQVLYEELALATSDPDYTIFCNYQIRCTDPRMQVRIHIFEGADAEEVDLQRAIWDEWLTQSEVEERVYA